MSASGFEVDKFTFLTAMFELLDKLISGFIIKGTKNADCSMFGLSEILEFLLLTVIVSLEHLEISDHF